MLFFLNKLVLLKLQSILRWKYLLLIIEIFLWLLILGYKRQLQPPRHSQSRLCTRAGGHYSVWKYIPMPPVAHTLGFPSYSVSPSPSWQTPDLSSREEEGEAATWQPPPPPLQPLRPKVLWTSRSWLVCQPSDIPWKQLTALQPLLSLAKDIRK